MTAPLGVYTSLGNHDYWVGAERVKEKIRESGFILLEDRTMEIRRKAASFYLSGIESRWNQSRKSVEYIPIDENKLSIVLSHTPDEFPRLTRRKPHLVLSGHTHGGQICLPFFGPVVVPSDFGRRYASGFFTHQLTELSGQTSLLYVSRGIGCFPPFRMLCDPEITLFRFT
jgi:predicted MPP superfamily phosphohydrolase